MNDNDRIIDKLKESGEKVVEELYEILSKAEESIKTRKTLQEIRGLDGIAQRSTTDIISLLKVVDPDYKINSKELTADIYFYSAGHNNELFCKSARYKGVCENLTTILDKITDYLEKGQDEVINTVAIEQEIAVLEQLQSNLQSGSESFAVQELPKYTRLFTTGDWAEQEKTEALKLLVKCHLRHLQAEQAKVEEQTDKEAEEALDSKAEAVEKAMETRLKAQEELVAKTRITVPDEINNQISVLRGLIKKYENQLSQIRSNKEREGRYKDRKQDYEKDLMDEDTIKKALGSYSDKYSVFLAFCIDEELRDYSELIDSSHSVNDIPLAEEMIASTLEKCQKYAKQLNANNESLQTPQNESAKDEMAEMFEETPPRNKLVFYQTDGIGASEFEKSVENLTPEKHKEVENLLDKLGNGNFSNMHTLGKVHNNGLKEMSSQKMFITFKIFGDHILIYYADDIRELNKSTTNTKLANYSQTEEDRVKSAIYEATYNATSHIEYTKLMSESQRILREFKEGTKEKGKGGSLV